MSTHTASGIGLKRLQHLVLWVSNVVFWTVPGGEPVRTRALDLELELARRGITMPEGASR